MKQLFPGVYKEGRALYTKTSVKKSVYGEKIHDGFREWNPYRSKPAAAILKGLKSFPISPGRKVLYLGVAEGTTASHFSDIIGSKGCVYGVEFAPRMFGKLLQVCEDRENIIPIMADANHPEEYAEYAGKVDVIYQDVAQPNQAEILTNNCNAYLEEDGFAAIAIKARSIDVKADTISIFRKELAKLKGLRVIESVRLEPFDKDHLFAVLEKKK